jgi:hypothetical protein
MLLGSRVAELMGDRLRFAAAVMMVMVGSPHVASAQSASVSTLDFDTFRTAVQPIFLHKREKLARCYVCHSQGTPLRLQRLSPGATTWDDDQSRKNFEAVRRLVVPGDPAASRLLLMPLAAEAGGVAFHPGGKHWTSQSDPEWQVLANWVRGVK